MCFAQDAVFSEFDMRAIMGDSEIKCSNWEKREADKLLTRNVLFRSPIKGSPMGPPSTRMNMASYLQWFSNSGTYEMEFTGECCNFVLASTLQTVDAPYGDYFQIFDHYLFELISIDPPVTKITLKFALRFQKSTWFQSLITSKSQSGYIESSTLRFKGIKDAIAANAKLIQALLINRTAANIESTFSSESIAASNSEDKGQIIAATEIPGVRQLSRRSSESLPPGMALLSSLPVHHKKLEKNHRSYEVFSDAIIWCLSPTRGFLLLLCLIIMWCMIFSEIVIQIGSTYFFQTHSAVHIPHSNADTLFDAKVCKENCIYNKEELLDASIAKTLESMKEIKTLLLEIKNEQVYVKVAHFQEEIRLLRRELNAIIE